MNYRIIKCTSCGEVIGRYPVYSHKLDEEDTGDPEYNENYGGDIEGDGYCSDCYSALQEKEGMI
jgi:DNA-directed RNA polymerase subunit N (RpoN/RPB10)